MLCSQLIDRSKYPVEPNRICYRVPKCEDLIWFSIKQNEMKTYEEKNGKEKQNAHK